MCIKFHVDRLENGHKKPNNKDISGGKELRDSIDLPLDLKHRVPGSADQVQNNKKHFL